jgi:glutamate 5-kinase
MGNAVEQESVAERLAMRGSRRVVVKVGSSTITGPDGRFNDHLVAKLVAQLAELHGEGRQVVLVSSGAVACGRNSVTAETDASASDKQAFAAIGQPVLMSRYETMFLSHGITIAQILLTREDFSDSRRAATCRSTLATLLARGIVPIVNENDTTAVDEIVVGDNDTLAAEVARLAGADLLVLLTDTDGLYTADPRRSAGATVIDLVGRSTTQATLVAGPTSSKLGTGGMATKVRAAALAASLGIAAVIANGSSDSVIRLILEGRQVGTLFSRRPVA